MLPFSRIRWGVQGGLQGQCHVLLLLLFNVKLGTKCRLQHIFAISLVMAVLASYFLTFRLVYAAETNTLQ